MNKSRLLLPITLLLLLLHSEKSVSQDVNLEIKGKKMSDFLEWEMLHDSKIYQSDDDIIIASGMAIPIQFIRKEKDIPDLIVEYVFTEKDSLIHEVSYRWDSRLLNTSKARMPLKFDRLLIEKYNQLLIDLSSKYGKSKSKGNLNDLKRIESGIGLRRSDEWVTKNQLKISLNILMSNQYKSEYGHVGSVHYIDILVTDQDR